MLNIIEERLSRGVCDDVLEVAWSTMWNVTDETPLNCQRFLEEKGMEYFLDCLKVCEIILKSHPAGTNDLGSDSILTHTAFNVFLEFSK